MQRKVLMEYFLVGERKYEKLLNSTQMKVKRDKA